MAAAPPSLAALQDVAARAVGHLGGLDGQVAVVWERVRGTRGERETLTATVTVVADGRAASASTEDLSDGRLARAAKAATANARRQRASPAPPLPEPVAARSHEGWDPAVLAYSPEGAEGLRWEASAARIAIASTRGVQAAEQRSHVAVELERGGGDRRIVVGAAGVGPDAIDAPGLARQAAALELGDAAAAAPPAGPLVLGAQAVAALLEHLRPAFGVALDVGGGPLAGRRGARVAAPAVNLSDSCRHPATLPRSFDAEGVPRRPVPLVQDGVAHERVHDSASAARAPGASSTGHATRAAALAPLPENLVLAGGGAESVEELQAPVAEGLYVPALARDADGGFVTRGAALLRDGRMAAPVADHLVAVDPLAVLASVEALTARQRLIVLKGHTPGGAGAATVPALRCREGVEPAA